MPGKLNWFYLSILTVLFGCQTTPKTTISTCQQWAMFEIQLEAELVPENAYTSVEVYAEFSNADGVTIKRPAFWDGGAVWKIRFASPDSTSQWTWKTISRPVIEGLHEESGTIQAEAYRGENQLLQHGLLRMSEGKRNVVHQDGSSFLVVGDTPWAIPFRATIDQVKTYAADRQQKGFNAALLMTVQPDMRAEGPAARDTPLGFMRAFNDLPEGHINELQPSYFQYLDTLMNILIDHEIVPVYQPVFHGFGWKGLDVMGNVAVPEEYERYAKYLLARYGSQPAFWLLAGDNGGRDPGVKEAGEMLEIWDAYEQPTGLHYNPSDDYVADWAKDNPLKHAMHFNKTFQEEPWLDFQWAQTGHGTEHLFHKVERMYDNLPTKAAANGEPTYEGMNDGKNGLGWWQGEDAWGQLMAGGTMGVVYGAAALWQWKVSPDEEGWTAWASQAKSWDQALRMEGSTYVGLVSRPFAGADFSDMEKRPELVEGEGTLLAKEDKFYLSYLPNGGSIQLKSLPDGLEARWYNPKSGEFTLIDSSADAGVFTAPDLSPWVLVLKG
ncbi:MAG: DUF4038 domain-containing protein [Saprospiraceae bacterium]|nr:DUF4038 domain-containing protein [Saprospiraceae bacterium]